MGLSPAACLVARLFSSGTIIDPSRPLIGARRKLRFSMARGRLCAPFRAVCSVKAEGAEAPHPATPAAHAPAGRAAHAAAPAASETHPATPAAHPAASDEYDAAATAGLSC